MPKKNIENKILNYLSKNLSQQRYDHTLSVCKLALKLAENYKEDIYNVRIAALLHDCAKGMSLKDMCKYVQRNKLKIKHYNFLTKHAPQVLHSFISEDISKKRFAIKNRQILKAIKYHTVARTAMSKCEKIIFVADCLSEDRKNKNIPLNKTVMFEDLDKVFILVLKSKISYVLSKFQPLYPDIINVWNYYNKNKYV